VGDVSTGSPGQEWSRRGLFSSTWVEAHGSYGKRGGGHPTKNLLAVQTGWAVALARNEHQCSLFSCLIALKYEDLAARVDANREELCQSLLEDVRVVLEALLSTKRYTDHPVLDGYVRGFRGLWRASRADTLLRLTSNYVLRERNIGRRREGGSSGV